MSPRTAKAVFLLSGLLLASVAVSAFGSEAGTLRADLKGESTKTPAPRSETWVSASRDESADAAPARPLTSRAALSEAATSGTTPASEVPQAEPGVPIRISIPAVNLDASIVPVGLADGAMEIPSAIEAGWYRLGPRPGSANGSAVLAGHVDHQKSPGVFLELRSLGLGEVVAVTDDFGTSHRFIVTERFQVAKAELPVQSLFDRDGPPVLTLITCGGRFDRKARSYDDNIVIRAVPADSVSPAVGRQRE